MDEIKAIQTITSVDTAKAKRTYRRGQVTKIKSRLDDLEARPLREGKVSELHLLKQELKREVELHGALQTQYEFLLSAKVDEQVLAEEECSGEDVKQHHFRIRQQADILLAKFQSYREALSIQDDLDNLANMTDITTRMFEIAFKRYSEKVSAFLQETVELAEDEQFRPLRKKYKESVSRYLVDISKAQAKEKDTEKERTTSSASSAPREHTKFDLALPTFSGKPQDWRSFFDLFSSTIKTRGRHLTDNEKRCLLLNAMTTEEAKEAVLVHSQGEDGYDKAVKALVNNYGSPSLVYPHHVRELVADDHFSYDRDSLMRLRRRYLLNYEALKDLKGDNISQFLAALAFERFDDKLREEWTKQVATSPTLPTLEEMFKFLEPLEYSMAKVEIGPSTTKKSSSTTSHNKKTGAQSRTPAAQATKGQCPLCKEPHGLARCAIFTSHTVEQRNKVVRDNRRCFNCLGEGHAQGRCTSPFTCRQCHQRHHTLLHSTPQGDSTVVNHAFVQAQMSKGSTGRPDDQTARKESVPLSPPDLYFVDTALVNVASGDRQLPARAALDSGSGVSLISERLASQLRLPRHPQNLLVEGAYGGGSSRQFVQAELRALDDPSQSITLKLSVIPRIKISQPPRCKDAILGEPAIRDLALADPELGGPLDIIICSIDRCRCVTEDLRFFPEAQLAATKTIFGWTITGPLNGNHKPIQLQTQPEEDPLQKSLARLWELDQVPESSTLTQAETRVVEHFDKTHQIDQQGRYQVQLPRIVNPPPLGESRKQALQRFLQNEKSLRRKGKLEDFNQVLNEYLVLDHAETVPPNSPDISGSVFYLPVHGVFKEASTTTKVRAVFDASARTSTGVSLNDILEAGPNFYPLLTDVLIRFRSHRIGLSADVSKMFREISLDPKERDLHRFFCRDSQGHIQECRMKRVTFGVKSSPYLATQVIRDLAKNHSSSHPQASKAILEDFYVDDYLSGADSVQEADLLRKRLCDLLLKAGMTLRKWRTSSTELRSLIPENLIETQDLVLTTPEAAPKALGIHWNVAKDCLHVSTPVSVTIDKVTKRTIASDTARVFDILGLFAPALLPARTLLQSLWKLPLKWDDEVPEQIKAKWTEWTSTLSTITDFAIPRKFTSKESPAVFRTLHGFSDASSTAYGAAVYLRVLHEDSTISVALVTAKARVLPVKSVTIPRAELIAAHMLAKLIIHVARLLDISLDKIFAWTDSTIVLCWLQKLSTSLKTFVANRIASIQEILPATHWRHVPTNHNPADILSRGMEASQLIQSSLWWNGPDWLTSTPSEWPTSPLETPLRIPEVKVTCNMVQVNEATFEPWKAFSSFHHLVRVISWVRRFLNNSSSKKEQQIHDDVLTSQELSKSKLHVLRIAQQQSYSSAYESMLLRKRLPKGHPLYKMNLAINSDRLLCVSSRVRDPNSPRQPKTLIPLSLESELTQLLVATLHKTHAHPGISALMSIIGDSYWIPGLRNFLKKLSRQCSICQRAYAKPLTQQMGLLPSARTTPAPPFYQTGIDFAGPFYVRRGYTRKPVLEKAYACIFVCLTTKAVHLELCSELSTPEFMAALRRFTARRGTPGHIHSDNGTNFVGAQHEIQELQQLHHSKDTRSAISHFCQEAETQWHFIPPRAPHFGGLWEAGVRSMKTLLRKIITPHHLRFDELYSVLTEVEAVLNSRPIVPLNSTNTEEDSLTPGHFLIGRPLKAPPTKDVGKTQITGLRRWTLVNRLSQDLWKEWIGRYLQSLHHRGKWTNPSENIKIGDLVYIKDEVLRYRDWPLAKVTEVYKGDDGRVRAADLRCHGKTYSRSVNRLIPLFMEDHQQEKAISSPPSMFRSQQHLNSDTGTEGRIQTKTTPT